MIGKALSLEEVATEQLLAVFESAMQGVIDKMPAHLQPVGRMVKSRTEFELRRRSPELLSFLVGKKT